MAQGAFDGPGALGVNSDQLRLLSRVARLYHEQGMRQPEIARRLHISQPRVSRLLRRAGELGIVRTIVVTPREVHASLEDELARRFDLDDVVVADTSGLHEETLLLRALGQATARHLEPTLLGDDTIGLSSWSATLSAAVDAMQPRTARAAKVVQVLGGVGNATAQALATRTTGRLAEITGAAPVYFPAPGFLPNPSTKRAFLEDAQCQAALAACDSLTVVLLGIGSLTPSPLLAQSGNALPVEAMEELRAHGAVGDVSLHFFDRSGRSLRSRFDDRILGISTAGLRAVPRRVGVAGGVRKREAIKAALTGGWLTELITDLDTAEWLLNDSEAL